MRPDICGGKELEVVSSSFKGERMSDHEDVLREAMAGSIDYIDNEGHEWAHADRLRVVQAEVESLRGRLAEMKTIHAQDTSDMIRQNKDMDRLRAERDVKLAECREQSERAAHFMARADRLEEALREAVAAAEEIAPAGRDDGTTPDDMLVPHYRLARRIRALAPSAPEEKR